LLGSDEARETLLDHVRLVSLGARLEADGRKREAEVYLADPDTGMVLVLGKEWTYPESEEPDDGPALAKRTVAARVPLGTLARGQLVSRAVKRSANHGVTLGTSRTGQTSLTPQSGDWEMLPSSILVKDIDAFGAELAKLPPRLLRPRVLASTLCVLEVGGVGPLGYEPGEQRLVSYVRGKHGAGNVRIVRRHQRAAPHALDVLAAALKDGARVRYISGDLRHAYGGLEMDPVAVVTDRVIVPDLDELTPATKGALEGVDLIAQHHATTATPGTALELASTVIEEACHVGLLRLRGDWSTRALGAAERMGEVGLSKTADRVRLLAERVRAASGGNDTAVGAAVAAWNDAALRVALAREALAG
jgi:hypothetical protein